MASPRSGAKAKKKREPELVALGERLAALRKEAGLSQMALADSAGLHFTYISRVERGERAPSYPNLLKLARGLGVAPGRLMPEA
jgi:transcriptional regulator with XRE-family HTH domain